MHGAEDIFQRLLGLRHRLEHVGGQDAPHPKGERTVDHLKNVVLVLIPVGQVAAHHGGVHQLGGQGDVVPGQRRGKAGAVIVLVVEHGHFGAVGQQRLPLLGAALEKLAAQLGMKEILGPAGLGLRGTGPNDLVGEGQLADLRKAGGHTDELGVVGGQAGLGKQIAVGIGQGAGDDAQPLNIAGKGDVVILAEA